MLEIQVAPSGKSFPTLKINLSISTSLLYFILYDPSQKTLTRIIECQNYNEGDAEVCSKMVLSVQLQINWDLVWIFSEIIFLLVRTKLLNEIFDS